MGTLWMYRTRVGDLHLTSFSYGVHSTQEHSTTINLYVQLTPFSSRPSYIPPSYSSGPMMFDCLIADFLCV